VQWILGVLAIVAVVGLLGTVLFLILRMLYTDTKRYWASLREMGEVQRQELRYCRTGKVGATTFLG
jgi:hypothetical protein